MSNNIYYQATRQDVVPLLPCEYSKVLEIGCGEGRFRRNLTKNNEYWGVEPNEIVANIANIALDKVLIGTYDQVIDHIPDNFFDLIICNDVIEHLPNHDMFLRSIKNKMAKNGCLVASIPNVRCITNIYDLIIMKDWEYRDEGILDTTHLRFFTEKSLKNNLLKNNYFIEEFIMLNPYYSKSFIKRSICNVSSLLLGKDLKFIQFGFRASPN